MEYSIFGKTDRKISRISFGCWEMGGTQWELTSDETNTQAIYKALDLGITSFDTAEGYGDGHSEEVLGKALLGKRQELFIATKVAPKHLRAADVRSSITASLKRLQMDYVDLYYIHWPNIEIPLEETMQEMLKIQKEGLIRYIGVSNFSLVQIKEALQYGRIEAIQPEYSLLHRGIEAEILPFCRSESISVMSYSSIAKGILTGGFHFGGIKLKETDFRAPRRLFLPNHIEKEKPLLNVMKEIADRMGIPLSQLAISWLFHKPGLTSALVGTQSEKHLRENIDAVTVKIAPADMAALDKVSAEVLTAIDR
ncbi:MAG: aldo/keto reductase [Treponema sp.]|jgi:aryl-alcohol dehydrogenase-like predicted oxidoreductase|nr:aldo/keto reductase [Treponema sp.]